MSKRVINGRAAAEDIRRGMDDYALMAKYWITPVGLESLYRKLLAAGLLTEAEVRFRRSDLLESGSIGDNDELTISRDSADHNTGT
ncbi:MAG: hypothetical protein FJ118_17075 [Deltaproteobacteria bacterium]|nr:hypothetical protein [Deltaproteobacteria bacterium]